MTNKKSAERISLLCGAACGLAVFLAGPAQAQDASAEPVTALPEEADAGPIDDIVVTAQRKESSLQRTPVAVTALGGADLEARQIVDIQSLAAAVPNFNFGQYGGAAKLSIRGLSYDSLNPGAEARVAYYVDGIYIARPAAVLGTFFDIDRVEVLRGPQGTLYGRNATGGAVNVITRDTSDELSGYYRQTIGNYSQFIEEGALSGMFAPGVSARIAFNIEDRDGYGENVITSNDIDNKRTRAVRGKLKFELSPQFDVTLTGDYSRQNDRGSFLHYMEQANPNVPFPGPKVGGFVPANPRDTAQEYDPINRREFWGGALLARYDLTDSIVLSALSGYRRTDYVVNYSLNGVSGDGAPVTLGETSRSLSQEVQLSGKGEIIDWLVGGYYFNEDITGYVRTLYRGGLLNQANTVRRGYGAFGTLDTKAAALFSQITAKPTDSLSLTVGLRFGWERKKTFNGNFFDVTTLFTGDIAQRPFSAPTPAELVNTQDAAKTERSFTPRFNIQYQINPTTQLYATISKGYKSGGFDLGAASPAYAPETVWDYEAGFKSTFLDGKLRTNLAAFYYDYSNLQVSLVNGNVIQIQNAASARIYGLEAEIVAVPVPNVEFDFSGGYLNARFKRYTTVNPSRTDLGVQDLRGNALNQTPSWTGTFGAQFTHRAAVGEFRLRGEAVYTTDIYFTPFNVKTNYQPGYVKFNATLNFESDDGHWTGSLFLKNIADKRTISNNIVTNGAVGFATVGYYDPPRTFGATIGYRF